MYCIQCGVKLADSERVCPLCGTVVFHPQLTQPQGEPLYPADRRPSPQVNPIGAQFVVTVVFLLPMLITLLCDLQLNRGVTWSGYVVGALLLSYVILVLPGWFLHPNPVVFVPIDFGAVMLYLLYIDLATGGGWFLSFAFPVTGGIMVITTTVVTLLRYLRRGKLYVFGGASIATGAFMLLVEYLANLTFHTPRASLWSLYPLTVLGLLGIMLLTIAICRPMRESLERKFFL
ncbi:MAG: DUF6320 domain-containing protein [Eubacteriales bacterium]|nr:DUF6320 domain-containing protein [Eubacteriales bacterium]